MKLTIDISMYPNQENFIIPIDGFIKKINKYSDLKIKTFPASTVVQGEQGYAMKTVQETILSYYKEFGMAVYVVQYIPVYEAL